MKYKIIGENKKNDVIETIFNNRGISLENVMDYINADVRNLTSYTKLDNIDKAVEVFKKHVDKDSNVLLIVDCDVDGFTSASLFYNVTKKLYPNLKLDFVVHDTKMHGLSADLEVSYEDYNLIVIPDASSNDYVQHKRLYDKGIDIIVLDHHEAEKYSQHAIVVNNQLSEDYPNKALSGVGIVWQFLRCYFDTYSIDDFDLNYYLDIVGVGNVADMVSLIPYETRYLVGSGLKNINNTFLKEVIAKNEFVLNGATTLTPKDVSWTIAPMINAMIRVGKREEKHVLFKALLDEYALTEVPSTKRGHVEGDTEILAQQAIRICGNARNKQNKIIDTAFVSIEKKIKDEELDKNQLLLIEIENDVLDPALIGLVANKIAPKYFRPTIICRKLKDSSGKEVLMGSIRNFGYSELEDFRGALEESGLVDWAQGK